MKSTLRQRTMAVWCLWGIVAIGLTFGHAGSVSGCQDEDANLTESEASPQDEPLDLSAFKPVELTEPPERKLTVVEQTEVRTQRPHVLSSTLLEKKFAAVLEIKIPELTEKQQRRIEEILGKRNVQSAGNASQEIPLIDRWAVPGPAWHVGRSGFGGRSAPNVSIEPIRMYSRAGFTSKNYARQISSLSDYFTKLVQEVPSNKRPSDSSLDFLNFSAEAGLYTVDNSDSGMRNRGMPLSIVLYVSSQEEAEEVGNALMTLFDYGVTVQTQQDLRERWQVEWERWHSLPEELAAAKSALAKHRDELAKMEPIPGNVIESIKQRRYNLDVDLQGVEARNDAIREAIKKDATGTVLVRLFELQIEAQIDLRGLLAQRDKLNEMIETFDSSERLKALVNRAAISVKSLQSRITQLPEKLELFHIASEFVQPLEVKNNEIRLYPVQWGDETPRR